MSTNSSIGVTINGEQHCIPQGQSIQELLDALGITGDRVAVELNGRIVKAHDRAATAIPEGGQIEIVHFVGGG